jgi:hypothetical protein
MSFQRAVPTNIHELKDNLDQIRQNRSHVKGVTVNPTSCHLEIVLDGAAHFFGKPDFYIPLKRAKVDAAKQLVEKMIREIDTGFAPSDADIQALYDMIDPQAK